MSFVRVLVVDDYEPFQRFICSTLRKGPDLQITEVISDGLEAVHKAQELHPDLIVLDLGLPTLNGIEAARQIRKVSPESKILFVSQESSVDVVQEALSSGALGYVVKAHAGSDLLAAVRAVLEGKQFVSSGLSGSHFTPWSDAEALDQVCRNPAPTSLDSGRADIARTHEVEFYPDDAAFVVGFARFVEAALKAGNSVIVLATESHQKNLFQRLQEHEVNVIAAIKEGRYRALDCAEILSTFIVNNRPHRVRCLKASGDLVAAAATAARGVPPRVAVCGECAPLLWAQGNADAAIQLEQLWDEIARTHAVDVLCGYILTNFQGEQESQTTSRICAEHSGVWPR